MPVKFNTEFNYRTQVVGETAWEKIKTLKGFLEGRIRAAALEQVAEKKYQARHAKLEWLKENNGLKHEILDLEGDLIELESVQQTQREAYELNAQEINILEGLLAELYEIVEPSRIPGYTDEQMFEINAVNEFTVWCAREIQAEIIANGRPSAARLRNAMSSPITFEALKKVGLIPEDAKLIGGNIDPAVIELKPLSLESKQCLPLFQKPQL
jgi:hypothetical protein